MGKDFLIKLSVSVIAPIILSVLIIFYKSLTMENLVIIIGGLVCSQIAVAYFVYRAIVDLQTENNNQIELLKKQLELKTDDPLKAFKAMTDEEKAGLR